MPPAPLETGASDRVRLARLALDAALVVPDVLGAEAGLHGVRVTADPPARLLRGVSVIAQPDGRYAVDLRLVALMVPLVALAEEVRRRVQASAGRRGLADRLGTVNVEFARLLTADEARRDTVDERGASAEPEAPAPGALSVAPATAAPLREADER